MKTHKLRMGAENVLLIVRPLRCRKIEFYYLKVIKLVCSWIWILFQVPKNEVAVEFHQHVQLFFKIMFSSVLLLNHRISEAWQMSIKTNFTVN